MHKGAQYAEDLWLLLQAMPENLNEIVKVMHDFQKFSGIAINYDKTKILRVGHWPNLTHKIPSHLPFVWTNEPIKILGIMVENDLNNLAEINIFIFIAKGKG